MFKNFKGFSLLELSIVIIIIGLLLVASFESTKYFLLRNFITSTNIKLNAIELALDGYIIQNGRLPCPSNLKDSTGDSSSSCLTTNTDKGLFVSNGIARGGIPFKTLDLIPDLSYDSWNNKIIYSVSVQSTKDIKKINDVNLGFITIYDNNLTNKITNKAIYSLASNGKDKFGGLNYKTNIFLSLNGINALEIKNLGNSEANENVYFNSINKKYDDIIRYRTTMQLLTKIGLEDINCCANTNIINKLADSYNLLTEEINNLNFSVSSTNSCSYLSYNEKRKNADLNMKYEIKCFKYGRLGFYKYE